MNFSAIGLRNSEFRNCKKYSDSLRNTSVPRKSMSSNFLLIRRIETERPQIQIKPMDDLLKMQILDLSLTICFIIIQRNGLSIFGERKYQPLLFMRSIFGFLSLVSLFYAASRASQTDVTILSSLSPFLITLLAYLFLKEKIARIQIPALAIAFSGAYLFQR